jgi:hypothetical protein
MTVRERANELFEKFYQIGKNHDFDYAKDCALIAVDEILNNFGSKVGDKIHYCNYMTIQYYQEVTTEIEKL